MGEDIFFADRNALLLENEVSSANKFRKQLKALGYRRVLVAADVAAARMLTESASIDTALLDVNLKAGGSSIRFGKELAADGVPVVFYSSFNAEAMAMATRGQELIEEPVSLSRLKAALLRAILRADPPLGILSRTKMAGQVARQ